MYALIALFDEEFNDYIRTIWKDLFDKKLSSYAYEVEGREPHLTLASFEKGDISCVIDMLEKFEVNKSIELQFNGVSAFLNSSMVTLLPVKTPHLAHFHQKLHQILGNYSTKDSLYHPLNWVPHVTIANRIDKEKFPYTFEYCMSHCKPIEGNVLTIKLIKVCENEPIISLFEKKLKIR
ncbi:2'-5' RNA ligase [Streptococcus henryi]|uniref:2'-5' RNA ligase n=1 Tax=Streptococcus henryi TaxID=439219 RepID=A0A1G6BY20_9STRE|nr:2'-5' RNA ligase family protein [Streptococcus henryi]SDB25499.1 2'-5' RNA ligase [Streptococcus henryi]